MKTSTAVGVAVVAVAALGAILVGVDIRSSDEAPIRVRNGGSMDIEAGANREWTLEQNGDQEDQTPSYSHEPTGIDLDMGDPKLLVKVVSATAQCDGGVKTAEGPVVHVEYTPASGGPVTAMFKRARSGLAHVNRRTKVRQPRDFQLDQRVLRHAPAGHISKVQVGGWKCEFINAAMLTEIIVCAKGRPECQP